MDKLKIEDKFSAELGDNPIPYRAHIDVMQPKGRYSIEHIRDGKVINRQVIDNVVTNEGKNLLLNIGFGATAKVTWYMGLLDSTGGTTTSAANTMSSHAGWSEFDDYASATRPAWGPDAAASQQITNGTVVSFAINATGQVVGGFITSNNTKNGTSGTLWSVGTFSGINVVNGDTLRLTYTTVLA